MCNLPKLPAAVTALVLLAGCGGGGSSAPSGPQFSLSLAAASIVAFPGQTSSKVALTVARTGPASTIAAALTGLPSGATAQVTSPGSGASGTIAIDAGTAPAGNYSLVVTASDGSNQLTQPLALTVGVSVSISTRTTGTLDEAMSTSFQVAEWNDSIFPTYPGIPDQLTKLGSQHIRMQIMSQDIPETAANTWDFTTLNKTVEPIRTAADKSPEFQLAYAPGYLYQGRTNGFVDDAFISGFSNYAANLVRYYNTGGFTADGTLLKSPNPQPMTYWGIYNEPNLNGVSPAEYVRLYNSVVPAMKAVDPTIKIVAVELSDFNTEEQKFIPTFVQGVTAPVDVLATHFYSSCNQTDPDRSLMSSIPIFATGVQYLYSQLATNSALKNVPIWILENNVNADYSNNGVSACNPGQTFVTDPRGSSAFFAAWRPYEFSMLGKSGAHALYHWSFPGDVQYGELNTETGHLQMSYWVDYWLGQFYPSPGGADILDLTNTDSDNVEALATRTPDGNVTVMVSDHAVASATDNNGGGSPRKILVDVSAFGTFTSVRQVTLDANTDPINGPAPQAVAPAPQMQVTLGGYGTTILTLHP